MSAPSAITPPVQFALFVQVPSAFVAHDPLWAIEEAAPNIQRTTHGPILEIGNTNSRYRFPIGARAFVERWNEQGPAHHCAVGVGHLSDRIAKLGALLSMDVVRVC